MLVRDVSSKLFSIALLLLSCGASCLADENESSTQVMEQVSRNILQATSEYSARIELCDQKISANSVPKLEINRLSNLGVNRQDVVAALAYLHYRNYFLCEKDERLALAFHLGTLASLKQEFGAEGRSVETIQSSVSYPQEKEIRLEIKYLALSDEVRRYFESVVGKEPFDLFATLDAYKLLI